MEDLPTRKYTSVALKSETALELEGGIIPPGCYLPLPDVVVELLQLEEGDELEWIEREDGTFAVHKAGYREPEWLEK